MTEAKDAIIRVLNDEGTDEDLPGTLVLEEGNFYITVRNPDGTDRVKLAIWYELLLELFTESLKEHLS